MCIFKGNVPTRPPSCLWSMKQGGRKGASSVGYGVAHGMSLPVRSDQLRVGEPGGTNIDVLLQTTPPSLPASITDKNENTSTNKQTLPPSLPQHTTYRSLPSFFNICVVTHIPHPAPPSLLPSLGPTNSQS